MSEQTTSILRQRHLPGLDPEATPLMGIGLGLTGLTLGLRPRLAPLPMALTALTAFLYRDPERTTLDDPTTIFAMADGTVLAINELYEHRYLHTDAICIATVLSPIDVSVHRSPAAGVVQYLEHVPGAYRSPRSTAAATANTRTYIGLETAWGPLLIVQIAGPLARRMHCRVQMGDRIEAGERIGAARFGSRIDLIAQRDSIKPLLHVGQHTTAGITRLADVFPL